MVFLIPSFKGCLKNIHAGLPFPGRREDFSNDAAFLAWKATEQSHLSQLMVMMVQYNPELAKATSSDGGYSATGARPGSLYSATPRPRHSETTSISTQSSHTFSNDLDGLIGSDDEGSGSSGSQFTYIPPNPRKYYKKLIEKCVEHDLRAMHTLPEDQEVSLGILSPGHLDVINECALRWRIMQSYRVLCFLDVIKYKYEREEVPLECIPEAITLVEKALQEQDIDKWHNQDVRPLFATFWFLTHAELYRRNTLQQSIRQSSTSSSRLFITLLTPFLTSLGRQSLLSSTSSSGLKHPVYSTVIRLTSMRGCGSYPTVYESLPYTTIPTRVKRCSDSRRVSTAPCRSCYLATRSSLLRRSSTRHTRSQY